MKKLTLIGGLVILGGLAYWVTASSRAFLERAKYTVLRQDGDFEVREYPALPVATSPMSDPEGNGAFQRLFGYIQGDNRAEEKIAMTVPVFMDGSEDRRQMSFIIPEEVAEKGTPEPTGEQVSVQTREAGTVAAYRFSGMDSRKNEQNAISKLKNWMQDQGLVHSGDPIFAYYDAPWIPAPLKRNEVMFRLTAK